MTSFKNIWRGRKERRRLAVFPALLALDLEILARALQSGSSLLQALRVAADDTQGPLAVEWRIVLNEIEHGASLESALRRFESRVPIASVSTFIGVVLIVQETGGNLAAVLMNLAETLRQEISFQGRLKAMTAQGKLSGYVVSAMPFLIIASLSCLAPEMIWPLFTTPVGWAMLAAVVILVAAGSFLIQKIVTIEV